MGGFSSVTGQETTVFADNVSFNGTQRGGMVTTDGQLLIGSTALPHIRIGYIASSLGTLQITNTSGNINIDLANSKYPITPYVVGPVGFAGYQTIQAAINAANIAGGGAVWIMPGTYTENLTLYDKIQIVGAVGLSPGSSGGGVIIDGVHTPPDSGEIVFRNIYFVSATDVLLSAAAGSTHITIFDSRSNVANGYLMNLTNWTGQLEIYNFLAAGGTDGVIENSGGSSLVIIFNSSVGAGSGNTLTTGGAVFLKMGIVNCPVNFTASVFDVTTIDFNDTVTISGGASGTIQNSSITSGNAAVLMSSTNTVKLYNMVISSPNVPAIDGAGAGTLTYSNLTFTSDNTFAGTLTLAKENWQQYGEAAAAGPGSVRGTASFDSSMFSVTDGFVQLSGGGLAIDQINVDANTGPGTDPVVPDASGEITVTGGQVASGTIGANVIRTDSLAANTYTIEIQRTGTAAAADNTLNGVSHFDSAAFSVDANGFVELAGGGIATIEFDVQANTGPGTDPVVPTAGGLVTVNGAAVANHSVVLETHSRAANTYNVEVQYAAAAAATDATKSGVAHFDSADFSCDASGFVSLVGTGMTFWNFVTTNQVGATNNGYCCIAAGGALTISLPAGAQGDVFEVSLMGATSWQITQAAGQQIQIGSSATTLGAGGSLTSTAQGDAVKLLCYSTNKWVALSIVGNITVA